MKQKLLIISITAAMSACTAPVMVQSTDASYEVMSGKGQQGKVYVVISDDLISLRKTIRPLAICSAFEYPIDAGDAIKSSIKRTVEGAYQPVVILPQSGRGAGDAPTYVFSFEEFDPRLQFSDGGAADATVEVAMRVSARDTGGKELYAATVRGIGKGQDVGNCLAGAPALNEATRKAIRVALENFVSKVVNIDWQRPPSR